MDGVLIQNNNHWVSGTYSINVDNLSIGVYNHTIVVYDLFGNISFDTVFVKVGSNHLPSVVGHDDVTYYIGTTGHIINWTIGAQFPGVYDLYFDDTIIQAGISWVNDTIIVGVNEAYQPPPPPPSSNSNSNDSNSSPSNVSSSSENNWFGDLDYPILPILMLEFSVIIYLRRSKNRNL
ncbi:MAG: hypothetical protein OEZ01_01375 [Candidatus Heimdallarchaeota archaeon]|nr:hypothetical protein [Candidatus Heimdallarchaeota archaeon]MDH5644624.1 hypothetical protein [Candidatus Heimdallarchaeota archaeon]